MVIDHLKVVLMKNFANAMEGSTKHPVSAINAGKGHSKNQPGSITVSSQHVEPWIPNLGLTSVEKSFLDNDQDICDKLVDAGMKLLTRDFPQFEYHSSVLDHNHLAFSPHPTIHIHHIGNHHFLTSSSTTGQVIMTASTLHLLKNCFFNFRVYILLIKKLSLPSTRQTSQVHSSVLMIVVFLPLPMQ